MRCKDCKYWERHTEDYKNKHFGTCSSDKIQIGYSHEYKASEYNNDELLYQDLEMYSANLETGENFGCIHFEF